MNSTVPAFWYPASFASASAASPMRARSSASTTGDGDSSTSFWYRRCSEQSRSPRELTLPRVSARICAST